MHEREGNAGTFYWKQFSEYTILHSPLVKSIIYRFHFETWRFVGLSQNIWLTLIFRIMKRQRKQFKQAKPHNSEPFGTYDVRNSKFIMHWEKLCKISKLGLPCQSLFPEKYFQNFHCLLPLWSPTLTLIWQFAMNPSSVISNAAASAKLFFPGKFEKPAASIRVCMWMVLCSSPL